jgi:GTP-sensing pleiotropic transcriptional regulator CodY
MMKDLSSEIKKIEFLLKSTFADLNNISSETFDENMPQITKKITLIVSKRKDLLLRYNRKDLIKYDKKLFDQTKQIQQKFDNIIERYKSETLDIAKKLVQIGNAKKIANYVR